MNRKTIDPEMAEFIRRDAAATRETRWERIGIAAMDTACLLISDPCYSYPYGASSDDTDFEITDRLEVYDTMGEGNHGQVNFRRGHPGAGVVVHSPHGDGSVEVWAKLDALNRVRSVFFSFDGEEPET